MIVYLKEKSEIEGFIRAGRMTGNILNELSKEIKIGITTKDIDKMAYQKCKENGGEPAFLHYRGFPFSICSSKNKIMVHGFPDDVPLKSEDIISIDFGFILDGFIGDVATTVSFSPSPLVSFCKKSLNEAIKKCYAGNKISDIGKTVGSIANENGFLVPFSYGGHGIDRNYLHSAPFIPNFFDYKNDITLYPGMVLAIEPMFIEAKSNKTRVLSDGWSVAAEGDTSHFEHTILITENEPIILTKGD